MDDIMPFLPTDNIRKIYKPFSEQIISVRKGAFFMKKTSRATTIRQNLTDKYKDNVICFVCAEVVLCR